MKINIINTYSKIAFGSVLSDEYIKQSEECIKIKGIRTTTDLFRDFFSWSKFSDYIIQEFPEGTKIYNFACSDGSEIYSLKMLMDSKLKEKRLSNKFDYLAFDINKDIISQAKENLIEINEDDKKNYKMYMGKGFEKHFMKIEGSTYKVIDKSLTDEISFEYSDITKWAKQKQDKPCVVMFRNAWPYLKAEYQQKLLDDLYKNLPSGSVLAVGSFDLAQSSFVEKINSSNFEPVKEASGRLFGSRFVYKKA